MKCKKKKELLIVGLLSTVACMPIQTYTMHKKCGGLGDPLLICATDKGNTEEVKALLAKDGNTEVRGFILDETPLLCAAKNNHIEILKMLLAARANTEAKTKFGQTALECAVINHNREAIEALLAAGVQAEKTLIGWDTIRLDNSEPVGEESKKWFNELRSGYYKEKVVPVLRAEVHGPNSTVTHAVVPLPTSGGHQQLLYIIGEYADMYPIKANELIISAAEQGNVQEVQRLVALGAGNYAKGEALKVALKNGYTDMADMLLAGGIDPELKDKIWFQALRVAAQHGYGRIVKRLIAAGVLTDERGCYYPGRPSVLATEAGHTEIVKILVGAAEKQPSDSRHDATWVDAVRKEYYETEVLPILNAEVQDENSKNTRTLVPLAHQHIHYHIGQYAEKYPVERSSDWFKKFFKNNKKTRERDIENFLRPDPEAFYM